MTNTLMQGAQVLLFLYGGIILGIYYDFLQPLHTQNALFSCVLDLLFYAGALVFSVLLFLQANFFELRLFALLAMAGGFGLYKLTLSHVLRFLMQLVINGMLKILELCSRLLQ